MGGAVVSLAADSQYVYAGTTQGKVWRRPRSEFVTAVRVWTAPAGELPGATLLNYPNPCNASTLFRFTLARAGGATLRLYDMLGRLVLTVLDRPLGGRGTPMACRLEQPSHRHLSCGVQRR